MDNERLIRLVRENPALYDYDNKKYRDTGYKEQTWERIAAEMTTTVPVCKRRWNSLRDQWRKIKKKQTATKKYTYDEEMSFLTPFLRERDPAGGALYESAGDSPKEASSDVAVGVQEGSEGNTEELMKYLIDRHDSDSEQSRRPDARDPTDTFFDTMREKVKRFTPYYRNVAETKIFTLVQQMEMEQILQRQGNAPTRQEHGRRDSFDDDGTTEKLLLKRID